MRVSTQQPPSHTPGSLAERVGSGLLEAVCPLFIAGIWVDALSRLAWANYVGRDSQIFAAVAALWERGIIPYRDVFDIKPPGIYVALRLAFSLWGYEPEGLRRLALTLAAVSALALYFGLRRLRLTIAAPVAAVAFFGLAAGDPTRTLFQFTEPWAASFAALAFGFAAVHQASARWWWAVATGVALGLAVLCKPPAILFALPLGLQLALWGASGPSRAWMGHLLARAALAGAGFAAVVGATAAYFAAHGALFHMYECVLVSGGRNYAGVTIRSLFDPAWWAQVAQRPTSEMILTETPWIYLAAVVLLLPLTVLRPSRWMAVAWAWAITAYFAAVVGPRGEVHYLWMAWPAQAVVLGLVLECTLAAGDRNGAEQRLLGGLVAAVLVLGPAWVSSYGESRMRVPPTPEDVAHVLGRKIRASARMGDTIHVDDEPFDLYVFSGLRPVTRFIYWNAPHPGAIEAMTADLVANPPTFRVKPLSTIPAFLADPSVGDYEYWTEVGSLGILRLEDRTWADPAQPLPVPAQADAEAAPSPAPPSPAGG